MNNTGEGKVRNNMEAEIVYIGFGLQIHSPLEVISIGFSPSVGIICRLGVPGAHI